MSVREFLESFWKSMRNSHRASPMCTSCLDADTADQLTLLASQSAGYERVTAFRVDRAARRPQIAVQPPPPRSAREAERRAAWSDHTQPGQRSSNLLLL